MNFSYCPGCGHMLDDGDQSVPRLCGNCREMFPIDGDAKYCHNPECEIVSTIRNSGRCWNCKSLLWDRPPSPDREPYSQKVIKAQEAVKNLKPDVELEVDPESRGWETGHNDLSDRIAELREFASCLTCEGEDPRKIKLIPSIINELLDMVEATSAHNEHLADEIKRLIPGYNAYCYAGGSDGKIPARDSELKRLYDKVETLKAELAKKDKSSPFLDYNRHVEAHLKAEKKLSEETAGMVIRRLLAYIDDLRTAIDEILPPTEDKETLALRKCRNCQSEYPNHAVNFDRNTGLCMACAPETEDK